jgi:serine phosphatase RsbU (regulator of sigma subunit)/predicted enzyme related to lactoylglutathione lyase
MAEVLSQEQENAVAQTPGKTPHLSLHHITIFVRDADRSVKFYTEQLGFKLIADVQFPGGRWTAVVPPHGGPALAMVTPRADSKEYGLIGQNTRVVFVTDDVPAKYSEWTKRGVRFHHPPIVPSWGGTYTTFEDADGNSFALAGRDEVTQQIEAERQAVAEQQDRERRAAQELEIARQVQGRLFPQNLPPLKSLDYTGVCIQARKVGGDYYDFLHLPRERVGLVIGDISGKGIAAALLMVNLQANLRSQCAASDDPQRLLRSVNDMFYENTSDNSYSTLFFTEYDDRSHRLRYANCGHLPAMLLRGDGSLETLDSTCTVLGLFKDWDCYMGERRLYPGDTLVLYTDGIVESFSESGEEFGEERLIETLQQNRDQSSEAIAAAVVDAVRKFNPQNQHDDITLIVAKCKES